jgi:hypothetical protein
MRKSAGLVLIEDGFNAVTAAEYALANWVRLNCWGVG